MRPVGCRCVKSGGSMRLTKNLKTTKPVAVAGSKPETKIKLQVATPKKYVSFT